MKSLFILAAVVAVVVCDKSISIDGSTAKVLGQSGKIFFGKKGDNDAVDGITIEFDAIKEKNAAGEDVGTSGQKKHSFNTFASRNFSFEGNQFGNYHGATVLKIPFIARNIIDDTNATLMVDLMIFQNDATFTVGSTNFNVKKGMMKFNVILENWAFCGVDDECKKGSTNEVGEFVEFTLSAKGKGAAKMASADSSLDSNIIKYELGDGEYLYMVKEIEVDGTHQMMKEGYPKLDTQGAKQKFIFAMPKGNKIVYDPLGEVEEDNGGGDGGDGTSSASTLLGSVLLQALTLLYAMWN